MVVVVVVITKTTKDCCKKTNMKQDIKNINIQQYIGKSEKFPLQHKQKYKECATSKSELPLKHYFSMYPTHNELCKEPTM